MFNATEDNHQNAAGPAPAVQPQAMPPQPLSPPPVANTSGMPDLPAPYILTPQPAGAGATPGLEEPSDDLLDIKQQALQSLSPLVNQLDQAPEEKFKTLMMLIQASDNSDLVKEAYATASQIPDEKARAQALIDVVNEINYFTQHQNSKP